MAETIDERRARLTRRAIAIQKRHKELVRDVRLLILEVTDLSADLLADAETGADERREIMSILPELQRLAGQLGPEGN